jgi:predicted kinase
MTEKIDDLPDTPSITLNRGLPASGKSTYSYAWLAEDPENRVRINRDDIRFELFNEYYPTADETMSVKEKEQLVTNVEYERIYKALNQNKHVMSDNTNLNPRVFSSFGKVAKQTGAILRHKDFPITIEEAIRRNNARERVVPESVIRDMARKFMGPNLEFHLFPGSYPTRPFIKPDSYRHAIIFDMDGTLTDVRPIRHLVRGKYRDFDSFHRSSLWMPPNHQVLEMAFDAENNGYAIVIVTARSEPYREVTQKWLDELGVNYDNIYMRKDGDMRKDYLVKEEILAEIEKDYDIVHAIDDNPAVNFLWGQHGIHTTIVPGFDDEPDPIRDSEVVQINNMFRTGGCLRCGKPLKSGATLGPRCMTKA